MARAGRLYLLTRWRGWEVCCAAAMRAHHEASPPGLLQRPLQAALELWRNAHREARVLQRVSTLWEDVSRLKALHHWKKYSVARATGEFTLQGTMIHEELDEKSSSVWRHDSKWRHETKGVPHMLLLAAPFYNWAACVALRSSFMAWAAKDKSTWRPQEGLQPLWQDVPQEPTLHRQATRIVISESPLRRSRTRSRGVGSLLGGVGSLLGSPARSFGFGNRVPPIRYAVPMSGLLERGRDETEQMTASSLRLRHLLELEQQETIATLGNLERLQTTITASQSYARAA